jgi:hypothetical protein
MFGGKPKGDATQADTALSDDNRLKLSQVKAAA